MRGNWQDFNCHDASRGPSAIAELLVIVKRWLFGSHPCSYSPLSRNKMLDPMTHPHRSNMIACIRLNKWRSNGLGHDGQSPRLRPRVQGNLVPGSFNNNFPVTVGYHIGHMDIKQQNVLSPVQNLHAITIHNCLCCMGRSVRVGTSFNRFADFGL